MTRPRWGVAGVALALAGAAGCSLVFAPDSSGDGDGGDAGSIDARSRDADPPCIGRTQTALAAINTPAEEDDPAVSVDGTLLVFNRQSLPDTSEIWFSTRATLCDVWNTPAPLPGSVNTLADETSPVLAPNDTTLTFARRGADFDTFVATLDNGTWEENAIVLAALGVNEVDVFLTASGEGFVTRDSEIYELSGGTVGPVLDLLPQAETSPWLNATRTEMLFAAQDPSGTNQFLIYRTQRPSPGAEFEAPDVIPLPMISVEDPWVTSDQLLYYAAQPDVLTDDRDLFLTSEF